MLKWLFRKGIEKSEALEGYLSNFEVAELAYLKNVTLVGLLPQQYPATASPSDSDTIDLATFIHGSYLIATGKISNDVGSLSRARSAYRIMLAKDMTSLKPITITEGFTRLSPHRLPEQELSADDENRLGLHLTMLERIHKYRKSAPPLPELESYGEGRDWESSWR